jgi:hypothetical protein
MRTPRGIALTPLWPAELWQQESGVSCLGQLQQVDPSAADTSNAVYAEAGAHAKDGQVSVDEGDIGCAASDVAVADLDPESAFVAESARLEKFRISVHPMEIRVRLFNLDWRLGMHTFVCSAAD